MLCPITSTHYQGMYSQRCNQGIFKTIKVFFYSLVECPSPDFLEQLLASSKSINELTNIVFAVVLISSMEFSQGKFLSMMFHAKTLLKYMLEFMQVCRSLQYVCDRTI